jgi:hypothetical protein
MKIYRNPRHWLLVARFNTGKSTFAKAMSPAYLVADLDGRWGEQGAEATVITESEPLAIVAKMNGLITSLKGKVQTIIYDSGTAILDLLQSQERLQEAAAVKAGQKYNLDNSHRLKADTMRVLRLAALKWHCDVLWIFHIEDGMKSGKNTERTTISRTEMERMKSNLNAVLTIVTDQATGKRGIRIEWARYNQGVAAGQVVWDDEGMWQNVPEKLDVFLAGFKGTEGYAGRAYSATWLFEYLSGKGVKYASVAEMKTTLGFDTEPLWFDRAGWTEIIKQALPTH